MSESRSGARFDAGRMVLIVGSLAFILRFAYILMMNRLGWSDTFNPDSLSYKSLAHGLLAGRGYAPHAQNGTAALLWSPLYPAFLALVYALAGGTDAAVRVVQALLGAGSSLLAAATAWRLYGRKAAWFAGILVATHPLLIQQPSMILTEELFLFLYMAGLFLFAGATSRPNALVPATASGAVMGLAILCRPAPLAALPLLTLTLLVRRGRTGLRQAALFTGGAILILAPWIVRGVVRYHALVPVTTAGEFDLYLANAPGFAEKVYINGDFGAGAELQEPIFQMREEHPPGWFAAEARRIILADPGRFLHLTAIRTGLFFKVLPETRGNAIRYLLALWSYSILFPLGVVALITALRQRQRFAWGYLGVFIMSVLVHIVSLAAIRYRVPLIDAVLPIFLAGLLARGLGRGLPGLRREHPSTS